MVILGATGDLMTRKIVPALFNLYEKGKLPLLTHIIGFSRRQIDDQGFRKIIKEMILNHHGSKAKREKVGKFLHLLSYQQGSFNDIKQYRELGRRLGNIDGVWKTCANKLFYLAVPPVFYQTIFNRLAKTGLTLPCGPDEGWTRVLVEKPFGHDADTAKKLDESLARLFKEEQIYRIDHYLAKEMLQNIVSFRFGNNLLEKSWDRRSIEKVEIRLWEKIGVEKRGKFYDGVGALRDVGQNHLLQMLALVAMDKPDDFTSESIRARRAEVLSFLRPPRNIERETYRAQYKRYRQIQDVDQNSTTETYFKIKLFLESKRWHDVPFILESGKRMGEAKKEIVVTFRHLYPCLCPPGQEHKRNKVVFTLEPSEGVNISFFSKKPGLDYAVEERKFDFALRPAEAHVQYVEEYEKLLLDAVIGDQTLFVRTDEVREMWSATDPITTAWKKNLVPLGFYEPDTSTASVKSMFIDSFLEAESDLKREIAIVGLGKMGTNLARRLKKKNWRVFGYNRSFDKTTLLETEGITGTYSFKELADKLSKPRLIWMMLPAGKAIEEAIFGEKGLVNFLAPGDIIIDGSNSFYKDTLKRYKKAENKKIKYLDIGVSGGPSGALHGASLMIGGDKKLFRKLKVLFLDLAAPGGVEYLGKAGAGHFVKMVHNGIEYGMMQAIAEGFAILKKSSHKLDLKRVTDIYNHGSVIESRLIGWLKKALIVHGEDLKDVTPAVSQTGEGKWTVETADKMKIEVPVIKDSVDFRTKSARKPSFTGKVLSALREQFGGHSAKISPDRKYP